MAFTQNEENIIHSRLFGDGTVVEADLQKLADVTASAAELNRLDATSAAHIAGLATTVAKTDIDDAGTIDGTEVAAALQAIHLKINAILVVLETFSLTASS